MLGVPDLGGDKDLRRRGQRRELLSKATGGLGSSGWRNLLTRNLALTLAHHLGERLAHLDLNPESARASPSGDQDSWVQLAAAGLANVPTPLGSLALDGAGGLREAAARGAVRGRRGALARHGGGEARQRGTHRHLARRSEGDQ